MSPKHPVQIDMETVCKSISQSIIDNEKDKNKWLPKAEQGYSDYKTLADHAKQRIVDLQIIQGKALELKKEIDTFFRSCGFDHESTLYSGSKNNRGATKDGNTATA
jgi:hypothetical protein